MKIVSICPSNTELIHYLGLTGQLIAVDDFSDWPEQVNGLPRLGPDLDIDMDKVEALKPDLVVASLSVPGMEKNVEELKKRGLPHIVLNPNTLDEIAADLLTLGNAAGAEEKAAETAAAFNAFIEKYEQLASAVTDRPSIYWEWWPKPVFTPGGKNWLTEISRLAGAENVFADIDQASFKTDWETVKERNPDHIGMAWVGVQQDKMKPELIEKRPGWAELDAVKKRHIHLLEESLYCRPSPRLLLGLKKLAPLIHPAVFPVNDGVDPLA
ncbi:cobalamin-binding protein [Bacillus marinisedimentorum]|uniref:cobalamin-binding protein n=1 Tax=Bacillus marinisedimentorum TaxID=1821260 RepID=UPI00087236E3|nr:cobalamin-binding protein [Bacillus marinisedimentorum]